MNDVIILAGGFGTRLKSVSSGIPKALMPIGNVVYLDLLLEKIFKYKFNHVYLSIHYKPELFQDYILKCVNKGKLTAIIEPKPLDTGGAVTYVIENSSISSPFIVINGDSISDINLDRMFKEFDSNNMTAVVGISEVVNAKRYGTVIEKDGEVLSFNEKNVGGRGWINNGHYIFKKEAFDSFNGAFSLEKDLFPKLVQNHELGSFKVHNDHFLDMGIPDDYEKLCEKYKGLN